MSGNDMIIDNALLDRLSAQARRSPRLRMNYDLRTTSADGSQRMLNALEPGTVLPIHRHRATAETVVGIRGRLKETFYDDEGRPTGTFIVEPCGECPVLQVPAGVWHSSESLESGTVIFEAKDGAYEPLSDDDILLK